MSRSAAGPGLGLGVARRLGEDPGLAARQVRDGGGAAAVAYHVDQPGVHPLQRHRPVRQQAGHGVRGLRHAGVAEDGEGHGVRRPDQAHGGGGDDAQGAFAAGQEPGQVGAVLRQQVLQAVAGHLPGEPAELGADQGQPVVDQAGQGGADRPCCVFGCVFDCVFGCVFAARWQLLTGGGQQVQADYVVGGAAVAQRPRAAGVVADRAADAGPGVRGGVGAEPQPVLRGGRGDVIQDRARFGGRGASLGVDGQHPVEVAGEVQHDAGADRVARDGGAAAPAGDRHLVLSRHGQRGGGLLGMPGEGHHGGHDPVVGGVGGVLRPPPRRVVGTGQTGGAQRGGQLPRRHRVLGGLLPRCLFLSGLF